MTASPFVFAIALACASLTAAQDPIQFRSGTVLVPLDVRVVDDEGNPITDLTLDDFKVLENGVEQKIVHFVPVSFANRDGPTWPTNAFGEAATKSRTFVIALGRGRLNEPTKALDALVSFVRNDLLPLDRVGVIAYLRASALTTDHESVARFLERYRERHEEIEGRIGRDFSMPVMGRPVTLKPDTRSAIDALFSTSESLPFVELPGAAGTSATRYSDMAYFFRTIEYLRSVEGEKNLVFVAQQPLRLGRIAEDPGRSYYVTLATGARVAVSFVHAGGMPAQQMKQGRVFTRGTSLSDRELFAPADHRLLAEQTGGTSAFYQYAAKPLGYLDRMTRFEYLLGYYPTAERPDQEHRIVRIAVNRPGVRAFYRHGYQVRPPAGTQDGYRRAVAEARISDAMSRLTDPSYRPFPLAIRTKTILRISASSVARAAGDMEVTVNLSFDPWAVTFERADDEYRASLDVAVALDDRKGATLGERSERVDVKLSSAEFERTKREWLACVLTVTVNGRPERVRAALYDYGSDRVASASLRVEVPVPVRR